MRGFRFAAVVAAAVFVLAFGSPAARAQNQQQQADINWGISYVESIASVTGGDPGLAAHAMQAGGAQVTVSPTGVTGKITLADGTIMIIDWNYPSSNGTGGFGLETIEVTYLWPGSFNRTYVWMTWTTIYGKIVGDPSIQILNVVGPVNPGPPGS